MRFSASNSSCMARDSPMMPSFAISALATEGGVGTAPLAPARSMQRSRVASRLVDLDGLGQEVRRAALHRLDGGVDGPEAGDDDGRQPGRLRQHGVEHGQLRPCRAASGRGSARAAVSRRAMASAARPLAACVHGVAALLEDVGQAGAALGVVLDEQDRAAPAHRLSARGSGQRETPWSPSCPRPATLAMSTVPPCCSTMRRTSGRPSPVPLLARREEGRRTRAGASSALMPSPSSRTATASVASSPAGAHHDRARRPASPGARSARGSGWPA